MSKGTTVTMVLPASTRSPAVEESRDANLSTRNATAQYPMPMAASTFGPVIAALQMRLHTAYEFRHFLEGKCNEGCAPYSDMVGVANWQSGHPPISSAAPPPNLSARS